MIHSFGPVEDRNAEILILGSMPGKASLAAGEYYAHPRNLFWPLLGELFGASPGMPYGKRLAILKANRIALWDVLASCIRTSSLDSHIAEESEKVNDFKIFFDEHPRIAALFFNGRKAEQVFMKRVQPLLGAPSLKYCLLPSTSPANASISYEKKMIAWQAILHEKRGG